MVLSGLLLTVLPVPTQATESVVNQEFESHSSHHLLSARTSTHGPRRVGRGSKPYRYSSNNDMVPHRGSGR